MQRPEIKSTWGDQLVGWTEIATYVGARTVNQLKQMVDELNFPLVVMPGTNTPVTNVQLIDLWLFQQARSPRMRAIIAKNKEGIERERLRLKRLNTARRFDRLNREFRAHLDDITKGDDAAPDRADAERPEEKS